jgi:hypothetical protein
MSLALRVDEHRRGDAEGQYAVDADAVRAELSSGVLGEADNDGVLGGGLRTRAGPGHRAPWRRWRGAVASAACFIPSAAPRALTRSTR